MEEPEFSPEVAPSLTVEPDVALSTGDVAMEATMSSVEREAESSVSDLAADSDDEASSDFDDVVFRVMNVESVVFDLSDASPQAHLMENEAPFRHLSIPIALPEAQALYAALNTLTGRRPSTHELASSILRQLQGDIIAVRIVRYDGGVFYAELDVMTPRGREKFDCRTSDAFILAIRQSVPAPILCAENILQVFYL
jgi:bifunctional DNase/RNase